ncbi:MAG: hypothetical protein U9Q99_00005, partial [Nanoarchaeota archaeon]|nr:hypothetical protein [Nanoarchaeota archaeon]
MNKKIFVVMLLGIFMLSLGSAELIDDAHGQSLSYDVNGTTSLGVFFKANTNLIFVGVTREHDTVTTRAILKYASNGTIIETSTNL